MWVIQEEQIEIPDERDMDSHFEIANYLEPETNV